MPQSIATTLTNRRVKHLRDALLEAQAQLRDSKAFAVALIVSGIPAAGRSETVNELLEWLDPKHVSVHAFDAPDEEECERPPLWRYWQTLPARGRIGIYFAGWYSELLARALGHADKEDEYSRRTVARIRALEAMLVADRVRVIKVHLHVPAALQRERLTQLRADKLTRWRVTHEDRRLAKHHAKVDRLTRRVLKATHQPTAPWLRMDGSDEKQRVLKVGQVLLDTLTAAPGKPPNAKHSAKVLSQNLEHFDTASAAALSDKDYEQELERLQGRFALLTRRSRFRKHALVLAFEGMDAAGKGGAIRHLTQALDARQYEAVPVSAPSPEEISFPYLWRFWRHIPERGQVTIFDRSWYGRVLVERVRDLTPERDWTRAYAEIREFELELTEHRIGVQKFWLSVSKDEQLLRFRARDEDPLKRFKVDKEDWANRRYYDEYQSAARQMIERTHAPHAPWTAIEADDKRYARLKVLRAVCEGLEAELER